MVKKCLIAAIVLWYFNGFAQTPEFEINGTVVGLDTGMILFHLPKTDSLIKVYEDKVPIKNGKFTFKGQIPYPDMGVFMIISPKTIEGDNWFYIDAGKQAVSIKIDSPAAITSNSRTEQEFQMKFKPKMALANLQRKEWQSNYHVLTIKYDMNIPNAVEDSMQAIANIIQNQRDSILLNYIKQNPQSYVSLIELSSFSSYDYKPIYDTCFFYLDNKLKTNSDGQKIYKNLEKLRETYTGAILPPIPVVDMEGHETLFDKNKLKEYTLCDFWFSGCGYCILQFPRLNDIYEKWKSKGFEMISISTDRKTAETAWRNVIKKHNLSWSQYWDVNGLEAKKLGKFHFPFNKVNNFSLKKSKRECFTFMREYSLINKSSLTYRIKYCACALNPLFYRAMVARFFYLLAFQWVLFPFFCRV
jgi:thiol-disulfide isomerase/thioredoxin